MALAGQYEKQGRFEYEFGSTAIFDPPVLSDFVVIQPGEKYSMKDSLARVTLEIGSSSDGAVRRLRPGNYVLRIVVGTWLYIAVDAESKIHVQDAEFREKWNESGFLWSDSVTSQAMQFTVDRDSMNKCVKSLI